MNEPKHMSLGDLSRRFGLPVWKIRRLFERKILPEPERVGRLRTFGPGDVPKIEKALKEAGYLK